MPAAGEGGGPRRHPEDTGHRLSAAWSVGFRCGVLVEVLPAAQELGNRYAAASVNAICLSEGTGKLRAHRRGRWG